MENENQNRSTEFGRKSAEGMGNCGAFGGLLGATTGAAAAVGVMLLFPGLLSFGAIMVIAVLAGAVTCGSIGAFIGLGIPRERVY